ncbi:hypothetical protein HYDPIDRAFT_120437 [Hydnomerulius pinastri MD-312]|uniref:Uncharacterized protein n=1 Tax=Hydnomerulius pinastri MD-312 TaxID=994086 RepID=A0A0C9UXB6_9AGAM|nr:hypothetical protein HYDPIDRAFT_120444 [Hydnomerulius pinastri MD-312]KIJ57698.1 hypothetical protein HYDPIDRAFT_120437 [Hydnomerulius pinastri MD-312]
MRMHPAKLEAWGEAEFVATIMPESISWLHTVHHDALTNVRVAYSIGAGVESGKAANVLACRKTRTIHG